MAPNRVELHGFDGEWRDLWWNRDFLELMARRWRLDEVERALDVGCGAGHWTRTLLPLLPDGAEMVGLDPDERFLALAAANTAAARCTFRAGRAESLPFADGSFDLVTCQTLLMHLADVAAAAREMTRVLRPGGLLAVVEWDNLAGNTAHLNTSLGTSVEDRVELFHFQALCERGKVALGGGDSSVGALLPGLFRGLGLEEVRSYTSDRCLMLHPPYDAADMAIALREELAWAKRGMSFFFGSELDARRFYLAGGGDEARFERLWTIAANWSEAFQRAVERGDYHAARGRVAYLVSGRRPR